MDEMAVLRDGSEVVIRRVTPADAWQRRGLGTLLLAVAGGHMAPPKRIRDVLRSLLAH